MSNESAILAVVSNIDWETDGDEAAAKALPRLVVVLEADVDRSDLDPDDDDYDVNVRDRILSVLSDRHGWLIGDCNIVLPKRRRGPGNAWGYRCPGCGSDEKIRILARTQVALYHNGTELAPDHDGFEWSDGDDASCDDCGWFGTVADLGVEDDGEDVPVAAGALSV